MGSSVCTPKEISRKRLPFSNPREVKFARFIPFRYKRAPSKVFFPVTGRRIVTPQGILSFIHKG